MRGQTAHHTSAAFFFSPEFQYTGYFVYDSTRARYYRMARDASPPTRIPRDVSKVVQGIIQNSQLSAATVEENKKRFADRGHLAAEFKAIYDLSPIRITSSDFSKTGALRLGHRQAGSCPGIEQQTETRRECAAGGTGA